jgi:hypothetical protein
MSANALIHPHAIPKTMAIRHQLAQYIQQQQLAIQKRLGGIKRHIMP